MNFAYQILRTIVLAASLPPLGLNRAGGRWLSKLGYRLDERHRNIVLNNLRESFPDKDDEWLERTARACFAHLGQVIAEMPYLLRLPPDKILARTRMHGEDRYLSALQRGKGVLLLTGHLGNWEWASLATGAAFGPACIVARPIDWPPADKLVNHWRTKTGHEVVPKANSARRLIRYLRSGGGAGILLDQNVDWYDGEWVDFFGRPACSNKGLALLAMMTGATVIPFYSFRAQDGLFDIYFDPEIPTVKTGDKIQDVWDNTQNYTKALEKIIRKCPEQWFWLHQRWKTKPYHNWPRENS